MNKILSILLLMSSTFVFAQATDDNEVMITQTGDTFKLYVDQIGFGNKIGLNNYSSGSGAAMTIAGVSLDINIDMIGNQNLLFGPVDADSGDYDLIMTGDSNSIDWNIGSTGSADDLVIVAEKGQLERATCAPNTNSQPVPPTRCCQRAPLVRITHAATYLTHAVSSLDAADRAAMCCERTLCVCVRATLAPTVAKT